MRVPALERGGDPTPSPIRVRYVGTDRSDAERTASRLSAVDDRLDVESVASPAEALDRLDAVDCLVAAYDLPDTDGVDLCRSAREESGVPFVLFAGEGNERVASEAIGAGVTDYVRRAPDDAYERLAERVVEATRTDRLVDDRTALETILDNAPAVFYTIDADGVFRRSRGNGLSLLGLDADEVVGESVFDVYADHPEILDNVERALDGEAVTATVEVDGVTFDVWYRPVREDGAIAGVVGFAYDVTASTERERQLAALHDASREFVTAESPVEIAETVGTTARRVLDATDATMRFVDDGVLTPVEGDDATPIAVDADAPAARAYRDESPVVADDGATMHVPMKGDGTVTITAVDHAFDEADVECGCLLAKIAAAALARVRSQADLERQNERLEEFASVVSHDLRNPLTVAQGRVDLAREECDSDHLLAVQRAHERMEALIEELLADAREGETTVDLDPVDLSAAVDRCWRDVDTLSATLDVEASGELLADELRLRQLLENLIRNAVEHAGADVRVEVGDLPDGFYVADDGPGIPEAERDEVFENGYTTSETGTGYGLAIVDQIADAHGWTVRIAESAAGGARFEITGVERPQA